ncbi:MAG TPA: alginate lyase family protein [Candidatus Krumholzibacteria bacterium]|nr:alginate lyase family protein [Candidatus Krumholzibacteria bacterium]
MSFAGRVRGALRRRWLRLYYERMYAQAPVSDLYAALQPDPGVDLLSPDGFQELWRRHMSSTPSALWTVAPPASDADIERARRGECHVLNRTFRITPRTDWHVEPFHGIPWPKVQVESFPYSVPGADLVLLWHLNRMTFVCDRVAAYRATRDEDLAEGTFALMDAWAGANPYLVGANWISPMETGLRLVYWSMALAGVADAPVPDAARCERVLRSVIRQAEFLASHFSRWPVPNNHLIGEAALLSAFAAYWPEFRRAGEWTAQAEEILVEEARRQVLADGFQFENSVNYHLVVLDYFLMYLHARVLRGETPSEIILSKTRAMLDAALTLVSPAGRMPMIGDDSMPHLLVLSGFMGSPGRFRDSISGEALLRPEHARLFTTTDWGRDLLALNAPVTRTRRFHEAGMDVVRDAHRHLVFTHGPQHHHPFASGHLHADAASFELELDGVPLIVDSGTYLYGIDEELRRHMRGARAHNTLLIDGVEPMHATGTFQWEAIATGQALAFGAVGGVLATGCRRRLAGREGAGVDHIRGLVCINSTVIVVDTVTPRETHEEYSAELYFHTRTAPRSAVLEGKHVRLTDAAAFVRVFEVVGEPVAGIDVIDNGTDHASWFSESYGEVSTGTTIRVRVGVPRAVTTVSVFRTPDVSVRRMPAREGHIRCAIDGGHARHIVYMQLDPFQVRVGGRAVTGAVTPSPQDTARAADELGWLDEIDA